MPKIYSLGDCPVCADSGAVLLLRVADSETMLFYCPLCGVAWPEPPLNGQIDEILALETLAPDGVNLPTTEEALGSGLRLTAVPSKSWLPFLQEVLRPRE